VDHYFVCRRDCVCLCLDMHVNICECVSVFVDESVNVCLSICESMCEFF